MKWHRLVAVVLLVAGSHLLLASNAQSTPYWGPEEIRAYLEARSEVSGPTIPFESLDPLRFVPDRDRPTYIEMYARMAQFLSLWQVDDPGSPDFGGIREGEHLPDIIQTDNTSESIWVWARYYELTGDNQYFQNILDAFTYSLAHPAYLEEGGSNRNYGYYRMYNCGWAVRAEIKYRDVYSDVTYSSYGDTCASYIRYNTLNRFGNPFNDYVNPPILSWALGNLYHAGVHESNQEWIDHAVLEAEQKVNKRKGGCCDVPFSDRYNLVIPSAFAMSNELNGEIFVSKSADARSHDNRNIAQISNDLFKVDFPGSV